MSYCVYKYPKRKIDLAGMIIFHQSNGDVLILENNKGELDLPRSSLTVA